MSGSFFVKVWILYLEMSAQTDLNIHEQPSSVLQHRHVSGVNAHHGRRLRKGLRSF